MSVGDDFELPTWGEDYELERYTFGDEDSEGHLIWHSGYPDNNDWERITMVTIDLDPYSVDGDFRNIEIDPDRPLDPWGFRPDDAQEGDWYDLDDLAASILDRYDIAY